MVDSSLSPAFLIPEDLVWEIVILANGLNSLRTLCKGGEIVASNLGKGIYLNTLQDLADSFLQKADDVWIRRRLMGRPSERGVPKQWKIGLFEKNRCSGLTLEGSRCRRILKKKLSKYGASVWLCWNHVPQAKKLCCEVSFQLAPCRF